MVWFHRIEGPIKVPSNSNGSMGVFSVYVCTELCNSWLYIKLQKGGEMIMGLETCSIFSSKVSSGCEYSTP